MITFVFVVWHPEAVLSIVLDVYSLMKGVRNGSGHFNDSNMNYDAMGFVWVFRAAGDG